VYEELPEIDYSDDEPSFFSEVKDSLSFGLVIIRTLILLILRIWPLVLIIAGLIFFLSRRVKSKKK